MKNYEIISLGAFCLPRVILTKAGLKPSKINGELSLPFDLAEHNELFITEMIESSFKNYFDNLNYNHFHKVWCNGNFIAKYNHDDCFGVKDKNLLINRYNKRISNFWQIVNNDLPILFIQAIEDDIQDVLHLYEVLKGIRNGKPFELIILDISNIITIQSDMFNILKIPYPSNEYIWWEPEYFQTEDGMNFERKIIEYCQSIIVNKLKCDLIMHRNSTLRLY